MSSATRFLADETAAFQRTGPSAPINVGEIIGTAQLVIVGLFGSHHELCSALPGLGADGIGALRLIAVFFGGAHLMAFALHSYVWRRHLSAMATGLWTWYGIALVIRGGIFLHPGMTATAFLLSMTTAICHVRLGRTVRRTS